MMHMLHTAHASAGKFEPGCIYCQQERQERDRKAQEERARKLREGGQR